MTTPYCSKDQWAKKKSTKTKPFEDWDDYAAEEDFPDANSLDEVLEAATEIMNDSQHINCQTTNITSAFYTDRLERICYNMANRILDVELGRGMAGGDYRFSPQDMLYAMERQQLLNIGFELGYRAGPVYVG